MSNVQFKNPNKHHSVPFFKHQAFIVYKSETEKYPDMVEVAKGPKWGRAIIGKKYLSPHFAMLAIDTFTIEAKIAADKRAAVKDLESEGFNSDESLESDELE